MGTLSITTTSTVKQKVITTQALEGVESSHPAILDEAECGALVDGRDRSQAHGHAQKVEDWMG